MHLIPEQITRKVARDLHTKPSAKNISESRLYRRDRFRSCGTLGYGPTMWVKSRKGANIFTVMIARQVRGQLVSYVGNNVGTKGEGQREPFSCSQGEADQ